MTHYRRSHVDGLLLAGGSADFTFTKISFAGSNVDDCVNVTDTLGGVLGKVCSTDASPTTFLYSHTVTGTPGTCVTQDNTATFTTNTTAITGSASQSVQLCTPVDLVVSKTANTSFTRTYNWGVSKSADKTRVDQLSGSVKFTYTVVAGQTGITDSSIQAAGTITITNPNDFEDITLTGVTDLVDNAGSCSITGSTTQTVKHGIPITLSYVCTYTSVPADGTNTATASWDKTAANTPDGSKSGSAAVSFGAPTISVNKTITPTDAFNGGGGVNLCTLTVAVTPCTLTGADATPFTTQTYVYSRNIAVVPNQCVTYPNTAATGTGQTSNASVTVCGPVAGGLTMGFWQNKNGQGIITGGASTAGVCNSGTWLQNYAPFQDLSATASCSGVATYVYNVIKAANASGSSMNAMLKAQMLATALDVYFSDPALGGNKINAPAPIGGIKVDLAKICNMLDSGGAGTCSGAFTNTSSAFGGGTCQTVSALLSYAAGQSNAGGSMWYLNVKSTQQLAKNTFDAINNQQAFTC